MRTYSQDKTKMNKLQEPAIAEQAKKWPLDTQYVMEHYHEDTVNKVYELAATARQYQDRDGATDMEELAQLLMESYDDLSNHFQKEEMMLFPYIVEMQQFINQGLHPEPFHCGSVQYPCRQMMMEHDDELHRYERITEICDAFSKPFSSSTECKTLTEEIRLFLDKLQEHIWIENEILFPRAVEAEGMEEM